MDALTLRALVALASAGFGLKLETASLLTLIPKFPSRLHPGVVLALLTMISVDSPVTWTEELVAGVWID